MIHPHVLVGIPCYDLTPITSPTLGASPLAVRITTSSITSSHGVTGSVYKTRERIHRSNADLRLLAIPASWSRVADFNPNWDRLYRFAPLHSIASHCIGHYSTPVALDVRGMMIWRHPHLPPTCIGSILRVPIWLLATKDKGCARFGT